LTEGRKEGREGGMEEMKENRRKTCNNLRVIFILMSDHYYDYY